MSMAAIAAGVAVVGAGVGAASTASSQRSANRTNLQNSANTNAANERLFRLSRGMVDPTTGQASAFLPEYFGGIESQLGGLASSIFRQGVSNLGSPADQFARANVTLDQLRPAMQSSQQAMLGEFNGANLNQRLSNFQPLADARTAGAAAQSDAIRQALSRQLGQISANRARGGFLGGSSFESNLANRSAIDAFRQAAMARSGANIQNAGDVMSLRNQDLAGRLRSDLPLNFANNQFAFDSLPQLSVNQNFANLMAPFQSFRMNPQAFQQQNMPMVQPSINAGQVLGAGLGSVGQTMSNYYLNNPSANQFGRSPVSQAPGTAEDFYGNLYGGVYNQPPAYGGGSIPGGNVPY